MQQDTTITKISKTTTSLSNKKDQLSINNTINTPVENNAEKWQKIPKFNGYSASYSGKIRNDTTKRIMQNNPNKYGYHTVSLINDEGKHSHQSVARFVASAWIENPDNKPNIAHINSNKLDDSVQNLKWESHLGYHAKTNQKDIKKKPREEAINKEGEDWELIDEDDDEYYVSNMGRIKYGTKIKNSYINKDRNTITIRGKTHIIRLLVAKHFVPNPDNLTHVKSLDGNELNDCHTNLSWCTLSMIQKESQKKNGKKVIQYDDNYNITASFDSSVDAGTQLGLDAGNINRCCHGEANVYDKNKQKLHFKFLESTDNMTTKKVDTTNLLVKQPKPRVIRRVIRPINVYDKDGKLIDCCKSLSATARKYKMNRNTIAEHCKDGGVPHSSCEYTFKYKT